MNENLDLAEILKESMKEDKIENNYNMHFETGSNPTIFNNAEIEVHGDFITTDVKKPQSTNENSHESHGEIPPSLATDKAKECPQRD